MWTYSLFHNGREIENVAGGMFRSRGAAKRAGEIALNDMCPRGSPHRKYYAVGLAELVLVPRARKQGKGGGK